MRIITNPTVTLIAKQVFLEHPTYKIPDDGNDATKIGAFAAKGCYDSFGEHGRANEANQLAILEHQHGSVLEHVTATVFIEGITRGLSLESNRHRQLAVSQRSTRYTAEEDASIVLDPYFSELYAKYGHFINNPIEDDISNVENFNVHEFNLLATHISALQQSFEAYENNVMWLMKLNPLELKNFDLRKWARGKARNLLPHALETRITYTGNMRAWRWFIESRSDIHAEPEIRRLADAVLKVLYKEFPIYFGDFSVVQTYDGLPVWQPTYRKV